PRPFAWIRVAWIPVAWIPVGSTFRWTSAIAVATITSRPSCFMHYSLDARATVQNTIDMDAIATASGTLDALGTSIMFVRTLPHPSETPGIGPQSTSETPVCGWL